MGWGDEMTRCPTHVMQMVKQSALPKRVTYIVSITYIKALLSCEISLLKSFLLTHKSHDAIKCWKYD